MVHSPVAEIRYPSRAVPITVKTRGWLVTGIQGARVDEDGAGLVLRGHEEIA